MEPVSDILLSWFAREGRDLPWRRTRDPYRIWLSEVILQQTRVAQGLEYYLRFTERFPDIAALAAAPEDEVLKLWQGLGYYSRARNLHAAARQVMSRFGGVFPATYGEVRACPAWATILRRPSARSFTTLRAQCSTGMYTGCWHGFSISASR